MNNAKGATEMIQATDTQTQQYLDTLLSRKGQIVTVETERSMKVRKNQEPILKQSEFQCRVGVNYDNIASVKEGRANGEKPAENAGLPWGEWVVFPYVIAHKGEYYVRCTVVRNNFRKAAKFIRGGVEISKEEAQVACLASEFSEGGDNEVFNIKVSSIRSVK
jgi:hypothetical protein